MSIPGLGQIPVQKPASATRTYKLQALWEYRFEVSSAPITIRLLSGTAERDGTELALNQSYTFSQTKSKLLTWHGCELEVEGVCDEYVAEQGEETPMVSYMNLHLLLSAQRAAGAQQGATGPRVLVCGTANCGRTSLCRMLAAWAAKMDQQTCVVNLEPKEGMLSLPGTLSAAVFATIMDVESEGGGWGGTPSSGPSAVPVKLPLVYYFGQEKAEDHVTLYKTTVSRLAGVVTARLADDSEVKSGGLIIDAPTVGVVTKNGVDILAHIVEEFSVNIVIILGYPRLNQELVRKFGQEKTSLGEPISVVMLEKSDGVAERDAVFLQHSREAAIREYFFGDSKRTLGPFTQQVDFDSLTIYKSPDPSSYFADEEGLEKVDVSPSMSHWTLAVMNASIKDSPDKIRLSTVIGFVYIADVDAERRRLKVMAPVAGRLGDRPLLWGRWPEPYINLLG